MDKKLYLHIGGPKTGTTALQLFLARNRQTLERKGFCYPGRDDAHWGICANLRDHTLRGIKARPHTFVRRCISEIQKSPCHTHIMSAECLAGQDKAAILRELIPGELPVTIVYYARRQDALIESWYKEVVKIGHYRVDERLDEEFLKGVYPMPLFNHIRIITPWAESFGRENVIVRCYEKQQMNGDIIGDFTGITGLSVDETFSHSGEDINASLDPHHLEFVRLCNQAISDASEINYFLINCRFAQSRLFENLRKQHLLSPEARNTVLDYYEESNQKIAREYLGRADGRLFYDPRPDSDEPYMPCRGLTATELGPIFSEMIATLDRQQRDMEPLRSILMCLNRAAKKGIRFVPEPVLQAIATKADILNR
ncbi:MAG: hypothetical protein WC379_11965 [Methanoregula sp.]|jgi:hypothetical protein